MNITGESCAQRCVTWNLREGRGTLRCILLSKDFQWSRVGASWEVGSSPLFSDFFTELLIHGISSLWTASLHTRIQVHGDRVRPAAWANSLLKVSPTYMESMHILWMCSHHTIKNNKINNTYKLHFTCFLTSLSVSSVFLHFLTTYLYLFLTYRLLLDHSILAVSKEL